jgi:hypothetical protein
MMRTRDVAVAVVGGALVAAFVIWGAPACGEPAARVPLQYQGAEGLWLRLDVAQALLADLQELPIRRREVTLLGEELELRSGQVERLRSMADLERAAAGEALTALHQAEQAGAELRQQLEQARAAQAPWWRSPILWLSVGVVVAVGLEVAAAYLLGSLR